MRLVSHNQIDFGRLYFGALLSVTTVQAGFFSPAFSGTRLNWASYGFKVSRQMVQKAELRGRTVFPLLRFLYLILDSGTGAIIERFLVKWLHHRGRREVLTDAAKRLDKASFSSFLRRPKR